MGDHLESIHFVFFQFGRKITKFHLSAVISENLNAALIFLQDFKNKCFDDRTLCAIKSIFHFFDNDKNE